MKCLYYVDAFFLMEYRFFCLTQKNIELKMQILLCYPFCIYITFSQYLFPTNFMHGIMQNHALFKYDKYIVVPTMFTYLSSSQ